MIDENAFAINKATDNGELLSLTVKDAEGNVIEGINFEMTTEQKTKSYAEDDSGSFGGQTFDKIHELQNLTRKISPCVAQIKSSQSYPTKPNKAHTVDLSRFVSVFCHNFSGNGFRLSQHFTDFSKSLTLI